MTNARISELEHSAWSMFSFVGRGPGGRIVDTPSRLVIETPVDRPPYNAVLRFHDEGDRPLRDQAEALLAPMLERGVTPIWLVHPTTDPAITDALVEIGLDCDGPLVVAADGLRRRGDVRGLGRTRLGALLIARHRCRVPRESVTGERHGLLHPARGRCRFRCRD